MKIGVLIDGGSIARWQADALRKIANDNSFVIYDCGNSRSRRTPLRHAAYYALNLLAVRNPMTRRVAIPDAIDVIDRVRFACEADGSWERLPEPLLDRIAADQPDVVLKFGRGLLRVPERAILDRPILSYHHGDPRRFRGRPAGFYELRTGTAEVGQVVQLLSNRLDAGAVLAFAETKAHPHSWRQTSIEFVYPPRPRWGAAADRGQRSELPGCRPTSRWRGQACRWQWRKRADRRGQ